MSAQPHHLEAELLNHGQMLTALARSLVRGADADDLVQATLLKGLQQATRPRRLGAFLRRVCRNLFLQGERARRRREVRERGLANAAVEPSAHDVVEHRQALRAVVTALERLPEHEYHVVRLRFWDGIGPGEIATRLDLPLATVKRRLERALEQMRSDLKRELGEGDREWQHALLPLCGWPKSAGISTTFAATSGGISVIKIAFAATLVVATIATAWLVPGKSGTGQQPAPRRVPIGATAHAQRAESAPVRALVDPPRSDAGPGERGSLRVQLLWSDGTPAAGTCVISYPADFRFRRASVADAAGVAAFAELAPGKFSIRCLPNTNVLTGGEVQSGEEAQATLTMPPGLSIDGRVTDRAGEPVAHAEILVGSGFSPDDGVWMAHADAQGRFLIRDALPFTQVAARAPGSLPSRMCRPSCEVGDTVSVTLELGGAAGTVIGNVTTSDGEPIDGATVQLIPDASVNGYRGWGPPMATSSDLDGGFTFTSARIGTNPILVNAKGFAPWRGEVDVSGSPASIEIVLAPQSIVSGTVFGTDGTPEPGADVMLEWGDDDCRFFNSAWVRTAEDGSFLLDSLPATDIHVRSSKERLGNATLTVETRAGEEVVQDIRLDAGKILRGRVIDERGTGLGGVDVTAMFGGKPGLPGGRALPSRSDRTDASGAFVLTNCPDGTCLVRVSDPSVSQSVNPVALLSDVSIDAGDLTITVDASSRPSSSFTGIVRDADDRAAPARIVVVGGPLTTRTVVTTDLATGAFAAGPLLAGDYEVEIERLPVGMLSKVKYTLAKGEQRDLGLTHLPALGKLRLVLQDRDSYPGQFKIAFGQSPGSTWHSVTYAESEWPGSLDLLPGKYGIVVSGARLVTQYRDLEITPGNETVVTLPLPQGISQTFVFTLDPDDPAVVDAGASIDDAAGNFVTSVSAYRGSQFIGRAILAPGEYHVRGHSSGPRGKRDPFHGDLSITVAPQDEDREWHVVLQRDRR